MKPNRISELREKANLLQGQILLEGKPIDFKNFYYKSFKSILLLINILTPDEAMNP